MLKGDGEKRHGRYLKKDSFIYNKVKVDEFSFEDINTRVVTYPDNPRSNVIHAWLHEKSEVDRAVKRPAAFFEDFLDPNMRAPVIRPRDFTNDWIEERKKARRRSSNQFADEDEFEMALEEEEDDRGVRIPPDAVHPEEAVSDNASETGKESVAAPAENTSIRTATQVRSEEPNGEPLKALKDLSLSSMDAVGEAIKDFSMSGAKSTPPLKISTGEMPAKAEEESPAASFEPPAEAMPAPEDTALHASSFDEGKKVGFEEGFSQGSSEGKKIGIEALEATKTLQNTLSELGQKLMEQCQENFLKLSAVICESILEKEFNVNPEAFANLVRKALKEGVNDDKFAVKISAKAHEALTKVGKVPSDWTIDPSLNDYQFAIESEGGVLRSDIKGIVASLIDAAGVDLFPKAE